MILISGILADNMVGLMCARLVQMRLPYVFLDHLKFPRQGRVSWAYEGATLRGSLEVGGVTVRLETLTGVYARYVTWSCEGPEPLTTEHQNAAGAETQMSLMMLLDILPTTVVNRPGPSKSNDSKVYQQLMIPRFGFATPRTLVTTSPDDVLRFYEQCNGRVIYKSTSSVRSIVQRLTMADLRRLTDVRTCPVLFQEYVEGRDIRVHTVGSEVFATEVRSAATDYRYAYQLGNNVKLSPLTVSDDIVNSSVALTRECGLEVAGIDLRQTSSGEYYCFEVNPSPAFLYYERATGQGISKAVAHLLAGTPDPD